MAFSSLRPLRHRNFALIWSAALVSNIGSWMQTVAVGVLVTQITHQAGWTGLVAAAAFLPIGLISPVGGAMADRVDRRRWFLATTMGETAFASLLVVLVATHHATPALVTLVVLGGGIMTSLGFPAYQALLPELVDREDLLGAAALGSAQFNLGRVVGPALTGLLLAAGSFQLVFALNAASFGAVLVALVLVRLPPQKPITDEEGLWQRIRTGMRGAAAEPGCRAAILFIAITALFLSPFIALIPAVALKVHHAGSRGTAILVTAQGVGAVVGALSMAPLAGRFGRRRVLVLDLVMVLPVMLTLYALAPSLGTAAAALVGVGAAYVGVLSGMMTVVQLRAPEALRARILSLYLVALGSIYPLGAVVQGALGDQLGLPRVTTGAAAIFVVVMGLLMTRRPVLPASLDEPAAANDDSAVVAPGPVPAGA